MCSIFSTHIGNRLVASYISVIEFPILYPYGRTCFVTGSYSDISSNCLSLSHILWLLDVCFAHSYNSHKLTQSIKRNTYIHIYRTIKWIKKKKNENWYHNRFHRTLSRYIVAVVIKHFSHQRVGFMKQIKRIKQLLITFLLAIKENSMGIIRLLNEIRD